MEGTLKKKSRFNTWQERYFLLEGGIMRYYANPSKENLKGSLDLSALVSPVELLDGATFKATAVSAGQRAEALIQASTREEAERWVAEINRAFLQNKGGEASLTSRSDDMRRASDGMQIFLTRARMNSDQMWIQSEKSREAAARLATWFSSKAVNRLPLSSDQQHRKLSTQLLGTLAGGSSLPRKQLGLNVRIGGAPVDHAPKFSIMVNYDALDDEAFSASLKQMKVSQNTKTCVAVDFQLNGSDAGISEFEVGQLCGVLRAGLLTFMGNQEDSDSDSDSEPERPRLHESKFLFDAETNCLRLILASKNSLPHHHLVSWCSSMTALLCLGTDPNELLQHAVPSNIRRLWTEMTQKPAGGDKDVEMSDTSAVNASLSASITARRSWVSILKKYFARNAEDQQEAESSMFKFVREHRNELLAGAAFSASSANLRFKDPTELFRYLKELPGADEAIAIVDYYMAVGSPRLDAFLQWIASPLSPLKALGDATAKSHDAVFQIVSDITEHVKGASGIRVLIPEGLLTMRLTPAVQLPLEQRWEEFREVDHELARDDYAAIELALAISGIIEYEYIWNNTRDHGQLTQFIRCYEDGSTGGISQPSLRAALERALMGASKSPIKVEDGNPMVWKTLPWNGSGHSIEFVTDGKIDTDKVDEFFEAFDTDGDGIVDFFDLLQDRDLAGHSPGESEHRKLYEEVIDKWAILVRSKSVVVRTKDLPGEVQQGQEEEEDRAFTNDRSDADAGSSSSPITLGASLQVGAASSTGATTAPQIHFSAGRCTKQEHKAAMPANAPGDASSMVALELNLRSDVPDDRVISFIALLKETFRKAQAGLAAHYSKKDRYERLTKEDADDAHREENAAMLLFLGADIQVSLVRPSIIQVAFHSCNLPAIANIFTADSEMTALKAARIICNALTSVSATLSWTGDAISGLQNLIDAHTNLSVVLHDLTDAALEGMGNEAWECEQCTYLNARRHKQCEMCSELKPHVAEVEDTEEGDYPQLDSGSSQQVIRLMENMLQALNDFNGKCEVRTSLDQSALSAIALDGNTDDSGNTVSLKDQVLQAIIEGFAKDGDVSVHLNGLSDIMKELSAWDFGREKMEETLQHIGPLLLLVGTFHRIMGADASMKWYSWFIPDYSFAIYHEQHVEKHLHDAKSHALMRRALAGLFDCCQGVLRFRVHLPQAAIASASTSSSTVESTVEWLVGGCETPFLKDMFDWQPLSPLTCALGSPSHHMLRPDRSWMAQMMSMDQAIFAWEIGGPGTPANLLFSPLRWLILASQWSDGDSQDRFITRQSVASFPWASLANSNLADGDTPWALWLQNIDSAVAFFDKMSAALLASGSESGSKAGPIDKLRYFDVLFTKGSLFEGHTSLDDEDLLAILAQCVLSVGADLFRQLLDRATRLRGLDLNTTTGELFEDSRFGGAEGDTEGTLLMVAAAAGRLDLCKILIEEHHVQDQPSKDGRFARCFAMEYEHRQVNSYLESKDFAISTATFTSLAEKLHGAFWSLKHSKIERLLHEASAAVLFFTNRPQTVNLARKLQVGDPAGKEYELDIDYRATPREVKRKLEEITGIPSWELQLWDERTGEQLDDNTALAVEVQKGTTHFYTPTHLHVHTLCSLASYITLTLFGFV
jgi:hypothetical protein